MCCLARGILLRSAGILGYCGASSFSSIPYLYIRLYIFECCTLYIHQTPMSVVDNIPRRGARGKRGKVFGFDPALQAVHDDMVKAEWARLVELDFPSSISRFEEFVRCKQQVYHKLCGAIPGTVQDVKRGRKVHRHAMALRFLFWQLKLKRLIQAWRMAPRIQLSRMLLVCALDGYMQGPFCLVPTSRVFWLLKHGWFQQRSWLRVPRCLCADREAPVLRQRKLDGKEPFSELDPAYHGVYHGGVFECSHMHYCLMREMLRLSHRAVEFNTFRRALECWRQLVERAWFCGCDCSPHCAWRDNHRHGPIRSALPASTPAGTPDSWCDETPTAAMNASVPVQRCFTAGGISATTMAAGDQPTTWEQAARSMFPPAIESWEDAFDDQGDPVGAADSEQATLMGTWVAPPSANSFRFKIHQQVLHSSFHSQALLDISPGAAFSPGASCDGHVVFPPGRGCHPYCFSCGRDVPWLGCCFDLSSFPRLKVKTRQRDPFRPLGYWCSNCKRWEELRGCGPSMLQSEGPRQHPQLFCGARWEVQVPEVAFRTKPRFDAVVTKGALRSVHKGNGLSPDGGAYGEWGIFYLWMPNGLFLPITDYDGEVLIG